MCVFGLHVCLYVPYMHACACEGQKRMLYPLELELQMNL